MDLSQSSNPLRGRRILVVEDKLVLAEELQQRLEAYGAEVLGPVPRVADALNLLTEDNPPDAAILDVQLSHELVYPVAVALYDLGVPFVFTTALHRSELPLRFADVPCFGKGINIAEKMRALNWQ